MFKRVGGKSKIKDEIIKLFPPHKLYVELFIGGGSIFFHKDPSEYEVINDLDKDIFHIYKDMQDVGQTMKDRTFKPSRKEFDVLLKQTSFKSKSDRLYRNLYISLMSYVGNRISYFGENEEERKKDSIMGNKYKTDEWKIALKNVIIENKDFREVIKKYDSKDTFFYLDPPYSRLRPQWGYQQNTITPQEVFEAVKNIKGKFLLSYNDTPEIRKIFHSFNIRTIKTVYIVRSDREIGHEVIIKNY